MASSRSSRATRVAIRGGRRSSRADRTASRATRVAIRGGRRSWRHRPSRHPPGHVTAPRRRTAMPDDPGYHGSRMDDAPRPGTHDRDDSARREWRPATLAVHAGHAPDPLTGAVAPPIYQTSTFAQDGVGRPRGGWEYARTGNPTRSRLEEAVAELEGAAHGLAYASGSATTAAIARAAAARGGGRHRRRRLRRHVPPLRPRPARTAGSSRATSTSRPIRPPRSSGCERP